MDKTIQKIVDRTFQIKDGLYAGEWAYSYDDTEGLNQHKYPFKTQGEAIVAALSESKEVEPNEDLVKQMEGKIIEITENQRIFYGYSGNGDYSLNGIQPSEFAKECASIAQSFADKQTEEKQKIIDSLKEAMIRGKDLADTLCWDGEISAADKQTMEFAEWAAKNRWVRVESVSSLEWMNSKTLELINKEGLLTIFKESKS